MTTHSLVHFSCKILNHEINKCECEYAKCARLTNVWGGEEGPSLVKWKWSDINFRQCQYINMILWYTKMWFTELYASPIIKLVCFSIKVAPKVRVKLRFASSLTGTTNIPDIEVHTMFQFLLKVIVSSTLSYYKCSSM